jgi:hypothetical protein
MKSWREYFAKIREQANEDVGVKPVKYVTTGRAGEEAIINLLEGRVKNGERTFLNGLSQGAYGDTIPWRERGKIERLKISFLIYRRRVTDAWLVLTGRAFIE